MFPDDIASPPIAAVEAAYFEAYLSFNNLAFPARISSMLGSKAILAKAGIACHPVSYVLPTDASEFLGKFQETASQGKLWLYKPAKQSGGNGIVVFSDEVTAMKLVEKADEHDVMQQYVQSILIDNCKVDMRVYVLVTERQDFGLHVYVYKQGYMRSCVKKYDGKSTDLSCHLTNVSFAKRNKLQQRVYELEDDEIRNRFDWQNLKDSIVQSLSGILKQREKIPSSCACYLCKRGCAQLFGFDILVDDIKKAWILEANIHPKYVSMKGKWIDHSFVILSRFWLERKAGTMNRLGALLVTLARRIYGLTGRLMGNLNLTGYSKASESMIELLLRRWEVRS